jgi:hypothetical protein
MLLANITRDGRWWVVECDAIGCFTQGPTYREAEENLLDILLGRVSELEVPMTHFRPSLTRVQKTGKKRSVIVGSNDLGLLAAAVLRYQRSFSRKSLADVAKELGASSRNAYAAYEQGRREPTLTKFLELLRVVAPGASLVLATGPRRPHR